MCESSAVTVLTTREPMALHTWMWKVEVHLFSAFEIPNDNGFFINVSIQLFTLYTIEMNKMNVEAAVTLLYGNLLFMLN